MKHLNVSLILALIYCWENYGNVEVPPSELVVNFLLMTFPVNDSFCLFAGIWNFNIVYKKIIEIYTVIRFISRLMWLDEYNSKWNPKQKNKDRKSIFFLFLLITFLFVFFLATEMDFLSNSYLQIQLDLYHKMKHEIKEYGMRAQF